MVLRLLLLSFLAIPSLAHASIAVPPIGPGPVVPVVLSNAAQDRLRSMLAQSSERGAGDVRPTGSMRPTFDEQCIVVVEKTPWDALKVGDIVLFSSGPFGRQTVAHRIVARTVRHWRTRGDACASSDPGELTPGNFHGYRVIAAIDKRTGEVRWSEPLVDGR